MARRRRPREQDHGRTLARETASIARDLCAGLASRNVPAYAEFEEEIGVTRVDAPGLFTGLFTGDVGRRYSRSRLMVKVSHLPGRKPTVEAQADGEPLATPPVPAPEDGAEEALGAEVQFVQNGLRQLYPIRTGGLRPGSPWNSKWWAVVNAFIGDWDADHPGAGERLAPRIQDWEDVLRTDNLRRLADALEDALEGEPQ